MMNRSILRGIVLIAVTAAIALVLVLLPRERPRKQHPPNDDPWVLVNYNPDDPYGTYLGNGFISTRIMGDGVGSQDGKPLPCYVAGFYDDEKLIPIPTWSDLHLRTGGVRQDGEEFTIDKTADYKQTLDMRTGILTTYATWRAGNKTLTGKIEVIVSRAEPNVGLVRATLAPSFSGSIFLRARAGAPPPGLVVLDAGKMPTFTIDGVPVLTSIFRTGRSGLFLGTASLLALHQTAGNAGSSVAQLAGPSISVAREKGFEIWSVRSSVLGNAPGVAADAAFSLCVALGTRDSTLKSTRFLSTGDPIGVFVRAHESAWCNLWRTDITIDGPRKDQQVLHSCMYYLLSSVRGGNKWSIPPMGLSNNAFSGHVFWDADIWMFPALILQHPELAKSIVEYRYQTLPGAMANAKAAGMPGAQYAWESGYTGKEDTPEGLPYRHERHINGDVALAQWQYYLATGDLNWLKTRGWPVIKATADWWAAKAKWVPAKSRYEILQVVPPDESADLINNSAYTNAIAKMNLEIATRTAKLVGQRPNLKWSKVAEKMYIPFDAKNRRFIAFDEYGSQPRFGPRYTAKQADTELLIYPLQFQIPGQSMTDIYENTFAYYPPRVHKGGPAMTSSAHSVIAARLGDCDRAYSDFVKSYKPFLRGPFNYFNEQPSQFKENMCFLTGAAGPVQAVLFGMAGIRMDYFGSPDLTYHPCLPKQWKSLKITGLKWRGRTFDLIVRPGNKVEILKR